MLPRLLLGALLGALAVAAAPALAERSAAVDAERQIGPLMPCSQCQLVCFAKHLYQPKFDCRSICQKYCAPTKHDANGETLGIVPDPQKDPAEIFKRDIGEVQLNVADDLLQEDGSPFERNTAPLEKRRFDA